MTWNIFLVRWRHHQRRCTGAALASPTAVIPVRQLVAIAILRLPAQVICLLFSVCLAGPHSTQKYQQQRVQQRHLTSLHTDVFSLWSETPPASFANLEKEHLFQQVNLLVLEQLNPEQVEVEIRLAEVPQSDGPESELDEMDMYKKENQRWLWHAIEHIVVKF